MSTESEADYWFDHYGVSDIVRVGDPGKLLYHQFNLDEASIVALMHPRVWWPWFRSAVIGGHGVGLAGPHWRQLTGAFVIHGGRVLAAIRHRNSAARPNYLALVHGLKLGATARRHTA